MFSSFKYCPHCSKDIEFLTKVIEERVKKEVESKLRKEYDSIIENLAKVEKQNRPSNIAKKSQNKRFRFKSKMAMKDKVFFLLKNAGGQGLLRSSIIKKFSGLKAHELDNIIDSLKEKYDVREEYIHRERGVSPKKYILIV